MFEDAVARRYSAALFALAHDARQVDQTVSEVDAFVAALELDPELAEFYASPVVARGKKIDLLVHALRGRWSELTLNFLVLLVRKRRETIVDLVARQMHDLSDAAARRAVMEIDTPKPMSADELAELARRLSRVYRQTLVPKQKISPELLGGIVVQVGDRYVDASVSGRLEELRRQLLATGDTLGIAPISPNGRGTT